MNTAQLMDHVRALSAIGPRPATSAAEERAHRYAAGRLAEYGARVSVEPFASWKTLAQPWLLTAALLILAGALLWLPGAAGPGAVPHGAPVLARQAAAAAGALGLAMFWGMASGNWEVGRLFARGQSRNVIGVVAPRGPVRRRVVLLAHADTQRATLFWHPSQVRNFGASFRLNQAMALYSAAVAAAAALYPAAAAWHWWALPGVATTGYGMAVLLHRELFCRWVEGANDNASGVAVALELTRRAAADPLAHTELWCVITGAEEVGAPVGADRFIRRHGPRLGRTAAFLVIDNVGAGDLRCLAGEGSVRFHRAHPRLLDLARRTGEARPDWRVGESRVAPGAYTDAHPLLARRLPALAIWAEKNGVLPNYHWPTDVLANVDPAALGRAQAFADQLIRELDRTDAPSAAAR